MLAEDIMDYVAERYEKRFKEFKIDFEKKLKKQKEDILIGNYKIMNALIKEIIHLTDKKRK